MPLYQTATDLRQAAGNTAEAQNAQQASLYANQAQQGQYPYAQQGSQQAALTGAASAGATQQQAAQAQPAQPAPTFSQLQQQGYARPPAPPPPMQPQGQAQQGFPAQSGLQQALMQAVMGGLQNPSSYGTEQVQQTYNRLGGQIDDQYAQQRTQADEEMARRGIYDSTIAGGRLHDLNIGQRSARTDLAARLAEEQARMAQQARNDSIGNAMGMYKTDTDIGLAQQRFGLEQSDQALRERLGMGGLEIDRSRLGLESSDQALRERLGMAGLAGDAEDRALREKLGMGGLAGDAADRALRSTLGMGQLGMDQQRLTNQANQFGQEFGQRQTEFGEDTRRFDANLLQRQGEFGTNSEMDMLRLLGTDVGEYDLSGTEGLTYEGGGGAQGGGGSSMNGYDSEGNPYRGGAGASGYDTYTGQTPTEYVPGYAGYQGGTPPPPPAYQPPPNVQPPAYPEYMPEPYQQPQQPRMSGDDLLRALTGARRGAY